MKKRQEEKKKFNLLKGLGYGAIGFIPIIILLAFSIFTLESAPAASIGQLRDILRRVQTLNAGAIYLNYIIQTILAFFERQKTSILVWHYVSQIALIGYRAFLSIENKQLNKEMPKIEIIKPSLN